jgi:hypothetical protein
MVERQEENRRCMAAAGRAGRRFEGWDGMGDRVRGVLSSLKLCNVYDHDAVEPIYIYAKYICISS